MCLLQWAFPALCDNRGEKTTNYFFFFNYTVCCNSNTAVKATNLVKGCSFRNRETNNRRWWCQVFLSMCASSSVILSLLLKGRNFACHYSQSLQAEKSKEKTPQFQTCRNLNSCCLFTGPASPISSQLKHSTGYSEGKWWMHRFWGYP